MMDDKNNIKPNSCRKVFESPWFSIDEVLYNETFYEKPYFRLSCGDAVGILAVTPEQKIILVKQFRPAIGDYSLELPAGYIDDKETAEEAVKRELKEETGFVCDSVIHLGSLKGCPSRINNTLHQFFGNNARRVSAGSDQKEECEVVLVNKDEFKKLVIEEKLVASGAIATYFLAQLKGFL